MTSLWDLGLDNFEELIDFLRKYGAQLTSLNLKLLDIKDRELGIKERKLDIKDRQFEKLVCYNPNIRCLSISHLNITESALEDL